MLENLKNNENKNEVVELNIKIKRLEGQLFKAKIFITLFFLLLGATLVYLFFLNNELYNTKVEASFTYNMLQYAVATSQTKDENKLFQALENYINNYYHLMSLLPDKNINSLSQAMLICYNERDELLRQRKNAEAFKKQQECKKLESEIEWQFYQKMKNEGFDDFMLFPIKFEGGE
ncbi:MAG: hypothetical protein ACTSV7_14970 [Candidatus Baldrarchaeia archaeon]